MSMYQKAVAEWLRDALEPGWRDEEQVRVSEFLAAIPIKIRPLSPINRRSEPCGECHLQPGERCDICGAEQPEDVTL
jgi:hypothetical protein